MRSERMPLNFLKGSESGGYCIGDGGRDGEFGECVCVSVSEHVYVGGLSWLCWVVG